KLLPQAFRVRIEARPPSPESSIRPANWKRLYDASTLPVHIRQADSINSRPRLKKTCPPARIGARHTQDVTRIPTTTHSLTSPKPLRTRITPVKSARNCG